MAWLSPILLLFGQGRKQPCPPLVRECGAAQAVPAGKNTILFSNRKLRRVPGKIVLLSLPVFLLWALPALCEQRTVAITVDDLPYAEGAASAGIPAPTLKAARDANRLLLAALKRHHVPVTGFVIEKTVEDLGGGAILKQWIEAGHDLGNHTYSHQSANALDVAAIKAEIEKGEVSFVPLMRNAGKDQRFLRFPFNHTGNTQEKHDAIAAFLKERGYRVAVCTIDNEDYVFNDAYLRALALHDTQAAARIRAAYLDYTDVEIDYYAGLNKQVLGREPPQVMLLHDNKLNADVADEVLSMFERKGYKFVTLAQAQSDAAYQRADTFVTKFGWMWGYRWARELNVHVDGSQEKEPPDWIGSYAVKGPQQ
jgi:peptidoglycan/xylan/chitin deacetylase (PgdA/CDA1 family)